MPAEAFTEFTTEAQRTQRSTEFATEAVQTFAHPPGRVNLKGRSSIRTQGVPIDKRPLRKRTSSPWANQQGKLLLFDRANLGSAKPGVTRSVCGLGGTVDESVLSENVSLKPLGGQSPHSGRQVTATLSVIFSVFSVPLWLIVFWVFACA